MADKVMLGRTRQKLAYDKHIPPEISVTSGSVVAFETEDGNCGLIQDEKNRWQSFKELYEAAGGSSPVTGPVYVEGAREGDCIAVEILRVAPGRSQHQGYTWLQSGAGVLEDIWGTFQVPLASRTCICPFEDGKVVMRTEDGGRCFPIPMKPFVGSIGTAPKYDRRSTCYQGVEWGGSLNLTDVGEGTTVVLPVNVEGALLSLGDVQMCQGEGGITGCGVRCRGLVEARIRVMSREEAGFIKCPQVNSNTWIGSVGLPNCADITAAMKQGYTDLVRRLKKEYGISQRDAYVLLGLAGEVHIGNEMCCLCRIPRSLLEDTGK